jgi:hypothetical protein
VNKKPVKLVSLFEKHPVGTEARIRELEATLEYVRVHCDGPQMVFDKINSTLDRSIAKNALTSFESLEAE